MFEFTFPVGYHRFHRKQLFNFQLNRWYSQGYSSFQDMQFAGRNIRSFSQWKNVMQSLTETAVSEGRLINAAFCCRAAEFYVESGNPEKDLLYRRFRDLFSQALADDPVEKCEVVYREGFLPCMRMVPPAETKGTIVLHGGFDSLLEEWYSVMRYLSLRGYEVIGFEGPGQGLALRRYGIPLTLDWEKPVAAVLDHFEVEECTLLGYSMGGWLCMRAAAFESRVKRVIADGYAMDYMRCMPDFLRILHEWCFHHCRKFMDRMAVLKFQSRKGMASWMVDHLMYITKTDTPMDAFEIYTRMNRKNIHSEQVAQDVLVLNGDDDHFIPLRMHNMQLEALTNARSVTGRIFTSEENAGNHCQTGNIGLALDVMIRWIEESSGCTLQ